MSHSDRQSPDLRDSDPWSDREPRSGRVSASASNGGFPVATLSRAGTSFGSKSTATVSARRNPFAFENTEPTWGMLTPTEERAIAQPFGLTSRGPSNVSVTEPVQVNGDFHDPLTSHRTEPPMIPDADTVRTYASNSDQDEGDVTFTYTPAVDSPTDASSFHSVSSSQRPDLSSELQRTMEGASSDANGSTSFDYERFAQLCSQGPLTDLQDYISVACANGSSQFGLTNDPNPSTGLVPLHLAAKEGKSDIVKWLVNDAGAIVEMEDREGETALHKAAMSGKLSVVTFLLAQGADADARDNDGWSALHNACSRGYLDIVRVLIDSANADVNAQGGRGGWTPLMNAASKGHLPVVRALTSKYQADPFLRNASGETAFDVAAATFEVYICEILERYEVDRWTAGDPSANTGSGSRHAYDLLALHSTVPVVLHENQRLDTRLQTLAMHGGKPRWSSSSAARSDKPDRRSPLSMPPGPLATSQTKHMAMRREDVRLPTRAMPHKLRLRQRLGSNRQRATRAKQPAGSSAGREDDLASTPTPESVLRSRSAEITEGGENEEDSHFWLCEWQLDTSHPLVDASEGWQYAQSFDALDDRWSSQAPPPLERLLEGRGLGASVTRAWTGNAGTVAAHSDQEASVTGWVRRRRWVRVMRRRLDIEFKDDLEACESALAGSRGDDNGVTQNGSNQKLSTTAMMAAQEAARIECSLLGAGADYVSRARALAGSSASSGATPADALGAEREELTRRIARLAMAITELRIAFDDTDTERRSLAEEVRKEFVLQLGQLREAAGLEVDDDDEDEDDEEFVYPNSYKDDGASVFTRMAPSSARPTLSQRQSSFGGAVASSEAGTSMAAGRSADLAANREFRVPTNEAPNKVSTHEPVLREQNIQPQWERDDHATECLGCGRRFTFFLRKHHCRRCGRIFCDPCSSKKAHLAIQDLVVDPSLPNMAASESVGMTRICNNCHAELQLPTQLQGIRGADALMPHRGSVSSTEARRSGAAASDVSSRASELTDCPVCSTSLAALGGTEAQEAHVRNCLENGGGGSLQDGRYLVYKLPETSPIVGKECSICMEDFLAASVIARLPCLCYFHRACIDSWFKRGRECPVHARTW